MWNFAANAINSMKLKKTHKELGQSSYECSDDEISNISKDEEEEEEEKGLECPICWESFNIVENIPYVLWCGHTLCQNCVLGLQSSIFRIPPIQDLQIPFLISCPWCHLLSIRLIYKDNLKFPRKNYFLLWMVESLNGDRRTTNSSSSVFSFEDQNRISIYRRVLRNQSDDDHLSTTNDHNGRSRALALNFFSFYKFIDFFIHFTSKFPYLIMFLLIIFVVIPSSFVILAIYAILTVVFAIPSCLVLYFAFPVLEKLVRQITS